MRKMLTGIALLGLGSAAASASPVVGRGPLGDYVDKLDPSYGWSQRREGTIDDSTYVELTLTSQTWRGQVWKHQLFILKPSSVRADEKHGLLFIGGGKWRPEYELPPGEERLPSKAGIFARLAEELGTPVAILRQVPHQPIFGGRTEDQIIALTFEKYLETGDAEWPVLLPMVKSAVRAMDAVQEYSAEEWSLGIESFTVTGASKRGWTTWLTGAVDSRVTALAPMVIDVLNIAPQLEYQKTVWGALSEKISDYTERGLHQRLSSEAGEALMDIVDPYRHLQAITQPKLIIIGTNDRYWPLDALNLYWDDLQGPKYALYIPNNRHSLKDYVRIIGSLNALHQHVARGRELPQLEWDFSESDEGLRLRVRSAPQPKTIVAWRAHAPSRDFREAIWAPRPMVPDGDDHVYDLERPEQGFAAMFGEAVYAEGVRLPFFLSTNVRIFRAAGVPLHYQAPDAMH